MGRPRLFRHVPALLIPIAVLAAGCGPRTAELAAVAAEPRFVHLAYPRFLAVRLRWEPLAPLPPVAGARPIVFVHLLDREGDVVRTFDHALPDGWKDGEAFEYEVELFQSAIAPALPAGEYVLSAGLLLDEGRRARLRVIDGEEVARREYRVAAVDVPPGDEALPMFRFSSAFQPVEPSGDVQFPARRWFDGEATLEVAEVAGAGTIYLVLQIVGESPDFSLRLEEGAAEPALWVTSSCSDKQVRLAGAGRHEVLLPLARSAACDVRLAPNFRLEPHRPGLAARSALLEAISWSAAP